MKTSNYTRLSVSRLRSVPMVSVAEPSVIGTSTSLSAEGEYSRTIGYRLSGDCFRKPSTEHLKLRKGFTLVELLIAVTIFSVVSVAVYSTFSSGMNVWRRAGKVSVGEIKNLIKIERMNQELRQAVILEKIANKFSGTENGVRFWTIIDSEFYFVTYFLNKKERLLSKKIIKFKDYQIERKRDKKAGPPAFPYIKEVKDFSFAYFDLEKGKYKWSRVWKKNYLPLAVKLNMTIGNEIYATTVFIPCA